MKFLHFLLQFPCTFPVENKVLNSSPLFFYLWLNIYHYIFLFFLSPTKRISSIRIDRGSIENSNRGARKPRIREVLIKRVPSQIRYSKLGNCSILLISLCYALFPLLLLKVGPRRWRKFLRSGNLLIDTERGE